jgi:hypothetical protein
MAAAAMRWRSVASKLRQPRRQRLAAEFFTHMPARDAMVAAAVRPARRARRHWQCRPKGETRGGLRMLWRVICSLTDIITEFHIFLAYI